MEVNLNINTGSVGGVGSRPPVKPRSEPARADSASFHDAEAVNRSLEQTPGVRAEAVARAQTLAADVQYPPLETITAIAKLLAIKLDSSEN
jgi:hypothetical protein